MIVLTAYGELLPGMSEPMLAASQKNRANAVNEAGCLKFDYYFNADDPNRFVFVEEWESKAHLDAHFATSWFAEFMEAVGPCLVSPPDIRIFEATKLE